MTKLLEAQLASRDQLNATSRPPQETEVRHPAAAASRPAARGSKAGISRFRRILRPMAGGRKPVEKDILDSAESAGIYKNTNPDQAMHLLAEDQETQIGIQISDEERTSFASIYWKDLKVHIHGRCPEETLGWLEPISDMNMAPPKRRRGPTRLGAALGARRPPPSAPF